jgi:hypothetical protein
MNSGDWVETMSALMEDQEGNWSLVYFHLEEVIKTDVESEEQKSTPQTTTEPSRRWAASL